MPNQLLASYNNKFKLSMKVYELEYKMKNARQVREINDISKIKMAKKQTSLVQNDEFLQSAEEFYLKNNFKREVQPVRTHNLQMNIRNDHKEEPSTPHQRGSKGCKSRINPDGIKRSVERDYTNNLEHWRKETFKYQEQVFNLQRKNAELIAENNSLKYELKLKQVEKNKLVTVVNPEKETANNSKYSLEIKIKELESQVEKKELRISELEIFVKFLTENLQRPNSSIINQESSFNQNKQEAANQKKSHLRLNIQTNKIQIKQEKLIIDRSLLSTALTAPSSTNDEASQFSNLNAK